MSNPPIRVFVATPALTGGKGGIARVMASLRDALVDQQVNASVRFVATRGHHWTGAPFVFAAALAQLLVLRVLSAVDVVHINVASNGSTYRKLVIAYLCWRLRIPYVLHLHGALYGTFWSSRRPWMRTQIDRMFSRAARVIVLGRPWRDLVAERVPSARIEIVPNASRRPTSVARRATNGTVRLLFLGRLGERKGVPYLVRALAQLRTTSAWTAVLAGDGDIAGTRADVRALDLADRVDVPGWVDGRATEALLAASDVLVLPSFDENLPMSIVEAFGYGLPVVATPVGAVTDIVVDGETGLLVPPGDVDVLSGALARLIEQPELRGRLGRAARDLHASQLDLSRYACRIGQTWSDVAGTRRKELIAS